VLWVLAYRFINPPVTATMLGDITAGRGADREWMGLDEMDRDMVRAAIGPRTANSARTAGSTSMPSRMRSSAMPRAGGSAADRPSASRPQECLPVAGGGYARKGAEAWFTFLIEQMWGKRRIMEVYLNIAETGIGTYGANAASQRYFGHDASAMTATEAARIAAILPLPKKARCGGSEGLHAALWQ
jgi:monofunctional biosynthetic peptidoglycan transglycosylase